MNEIIDGCLIKTIGHSTELVMMTGVFRGSRMRTHPKGLYARIKANSEFHLNREGIKILNTHDKPVVIKVVALHPTLSNDAEEKAGHDGKPSLHPRKETR